MTKMTTMAELSEKAILAHAALKVTHQGKWKISDDIEIDCYVTSDKRRFLSLRGTAETYPKSCV